MFSIPNTVLCLDHAPSLDWGNAFDPKLKKALEGRNTCLTLAKKINRKRTKTIAVKYFCNK